MSDFSAKVQVFANLAPLHKEFPAFEIAVQVDNIDIITGLGVVEHLLRIQYTILDLWLEKEQELVQRWSN